MKPEELLRQALSHPRGIKVETEEVDRLRQAIYAKARKLSIPISTMVPADAPNQLWIMPRKELEI